MLNHYKSFYLPFEFETLRKFCQKELLFLFFGFFFVLISFYKNNINSSASYMLIANIPYLLYIKYAYLNYNILKFKKNLKQKILHHILFLGFIFSLLLYLIVSFNLKAKKNMLDFWTNVSIIYFAIIIIFGLIQKLKIYQLLKKKNYLWNQKILGSSKNNLKNNLIEKIKFKYQNFLSIYIDSIIDFKYFFLIYIIYMLSMSFILTKDIFSNYDNTSSYEIENLEIHSNFFEKNEKNLIEDALAKSNNPTISLHLDTNKLSPTELSFQSFRTIDINSYFLFIGFLIVLSSVINIVRFERIDYSIISSLILGIFSLWHFCIGILFDFHYSIIFILIYCSILGFLIEWSSNYFYLTKINKNKSSQESLCQYILTFFKKEFIYIMFLIILLLGIYLFKDLQYQNTFFYLSIIFSSIFFSYPIILSTFSSINAELKPLKEKILSFWKNYFSTTTKIISILILLFNHLYILRMLIKHNNLKILYLFILSIIPYYLFLVLLKTIVTTLKLRNKNSEDNPSEDFFKSKKYLLYKKILTKNLSYMNLIITLVFLGYIITQKPDLQNNISNTLATRLTGISNEKAFLNPNNENLLVAIHGISQDLFLNEFNEFKKHPFSKMEHIEYIKNEVFNNKNYLIFLIETDTHTKTFHSFYNKLELRKLFLDEINYFLNVVKVKHNYSFFILDTNALQKYQLLADHEFYFPLIFVLGGLIYYFINCFMKHRYFRNKLSGIFLFSPFLITHIIFHYFSIKIPITFIIIDYAFLSIFICIYLGHKKENFIFKYSNYFYFLLGALSILIVLKTKNVHYNLIAYSYSICLFMLVIKFYLLNPYYYLSMHNGIHNKSSSFKKADYKFVNNDNNTELPF